MVKSFISTRRTCGPATMRQVLLVWCSIAGASRKIKMQAENATATGSAVVSKEIPLTIPSLSSSMSTQRFNQNDFTLIGEGYCRTSSNSIGEFVVCNTPECRTLKGCQEECVNGDFIEDCALNGCETELHHKGSLEHIRCQGIEFTDNYKGNDEWRRCELHLLPITHTQTAMGNTASCWHRAWNLWTWIGG